MLVLQAVKNAVLRGIVVGYLLDRLKRLGFGPAATGLSAVLRGSYHLYQGFGPFLGNAIMGVVFAQWYRRRGRIPLIVAHTILDTVSFVGYDLARPLPAPALGGAPPPIRWRRRWRVGGVSPGRAPSPDVTTVARSSRRL